MSALPDSVDALYLHIPFCERKCEYCDFVSVAGARGQHAYVDALRSELRALAPALAGSTLQTIFCGGGTPGLLDLRLMGSLMAEVRDLFTIAPVAEITLEVNPSSTSVARATAWRAAGFNRVSVGVQSTHADILAFLGRVHDGGRALSALHDVRQAGFDNVSADLIYAVPGLDDVRWSESLHAVLEAAPDHLSCYELTVETGTPLHSAVAAGRLRPVEPESALRQHRIAVQSLAGAGYEQYEVSNYSLPSAECRHNLVYWRNGAYAAVGVGAHGHLPAATARRLGLEPPENAVAVRYEHGRNVAAYVDAVPRGGSWRSLEWITPEMRAEETVMLGLRLAEGIALGAPAWGSEALALAEGGFLDLRGNRARVTARGEDVLNQVAVRLAAEVAVW